MYEKFLNEISLDQNNCKYIKLYKKYSMKKDEAFSVEAVFSIKKVERISNLFE